MKKIGILGGTFNPPHIGHCIIANEVRHALALDEVRLMPNAIAPHKMMENSPSNEARKTMLELAITGVEGLTVESIELSRGGVSYSYDTMKALCESEPQSTFYFIIGGDSIDTLHTWHRIDELVELVTFVGVNRPNAMAKSNYPVEMVSIPEINLSSSMIRERLEKGESIHYLVPEKVECFIREEGLYGK